ncbi:MAG: baseplate J/gp47 family protein [Clostridiales bacterium]
MSTDEFTATNLLNRMLSRIPDSLDKREGSIIYDALAPAAYEISASYRLLFNAYEEAFISTAQGAALDMRVQEMGLTRHPPTKSLVKGIFKDSVGGTMDVPIGARFTAMNPTMSHTYVALAKITVGTFKLEAESLGAAPNDYIGELSPVTHIDGLGSAVITEILIPGEDEETDTALRERYFNYINSEIQDGNTAQYETWAAEYIGIGRAKVMPLWNGANTVKVSILDVDNKKASQTLIEAFQRYLDPGALGLGNGVAPIGAKVTVSTATEKIVNITAKVSIMDGYIFSVVQENIKKAISKFLADTAYKRSAVFLMDIGAAMLNADGVSFITELKLNNAQLDITLAPEEIGLLGTITLSEVV